MSLSRYLEDAIHAARLAQGIHRYYQSKGFATASKSTISDLVTEADREAERQVKEYLLARYPDHAFLGEEEGQSGEGELTWIVDPLDGTVNFAHRFPFFAVSVALARGDEVLVAVVLDSPHDELFTAVKGQGAYLNGARIRVSDTRELARSLLATGFPYQVEKAEEALKLFTRVLMRGLPIRRPGAAALDLAYVAAGRIDGFWEMKLNPWDVAAGVLLIQEAGGRISDLEGRPFHLRSPYIVASNGHIHDQLLEALGETEG